MSGRSGSFSPQGVPDRSSSDTGDGVEKSRKPDNTAFKQQRLPAWQPILTAESVLPAFFIICIIFIPVGVTLLLASNEIIEVSREYTQCNSGTCAELRGNESRMTEPCTCVVDIKVLKNMSGTVYVYYGLTNYFQNHRRYVRSRDDNQLHGADTSVVSSECKPYREDNGTLIAPCGAIANSLFNDTFSLTGTSGPITIDLTGIAWPTDKNQKFNNPPGATLRAAFNGTTKPKFWQKPVYELDPTDSDNNGYENEGFIVWMRTAAFPTFRKPYGRIAGGLAAGNYSVTIAYNYPVVSFSGTKRIIFTTTSWIGGKNSFLGIAYIVVGSLCFAVGVALCIVHHVTKKKNGTSPR